MYPGCHNGPPVGGALYQKSGRIILIKTASKMEGGKVVTGKDTDLNVFKVPTLRNIELIDPYFHDGAVATLGGVKIMGKTQLDRDLIRRRLAVVLLS